MIHTVPRPYLFDGAEQWQIVIDTTTIAARGKADHHGWNCRRGSRREDAVAKKGTFDRKKPQGKKQGRKIDFAFGANVTAKKRKGGFGGGS
jgi:hypothetical protein